MLNHKTFAKTKLTNSILSAVTAVILLFSAIGFAHEQQIFNQDKQISVYNLHDKSKTIYQVDDKRFTWEQLSSSQQAKLTEIENKLKQAENAFAYNDPKVDALLKEIEVQAKAIEKEAKAIELATIQIDKKTASFADISRWSQQLSSTAQINEQAIKEKSKALQQLEQQLPKVDKGQVALLEQHSQELELALIDIASTL